jgi:hypothetical protein
MNGQAGELGGVKGRTSACPFLYRPQRNMPIWLEKLSTDGLEELILLRYESGASQDELDMLETIFAARVSEEDLNVTEEDIYMSEEQFNGASLEEGLYDLYRRYLQPRGRRDGLMDDADILGGLRSWMEECGFSLGGLKKSVTNEQIFEAARDIYERKQARLGQYRVCQRSLAGHLGE